MNFPLFFVSRMIKRDQKKSYFLLSILLTLALTVFINIITLVYNYLKQEIITAQITSGKWHLIFAVEEDINLQKIIDLECIENATIGYRLEPQRIKETNFSLDLILFQREKFFDFTMPLIAGVIPNKEGEIIVPDWYLRYQNLDKKDLPVNLVTENGNFRITGVYKGNTNLIKTYNLNGFGIIEDNKNLLIEGNLSINPSFRSLVSHSVDEDWQYKKFIYLKIAENYQINDTVRVLEKIDGIISFPYIDEFVGFGKKSSSPEYNNKLILAEKRGGIENLIINQEMNYIKLLPYVSYIIFLGTVFFIVFVGINLLIENLYKYLGILSSIGMEFKKFIIIILFLLIFLGSISLVAGIGLGLTLSITILNKTLKNLYGVVEIPQREIIYLIILFVISLFIGGLLPIMKGRKLSPIMILREGIERNIKEIASPLVKLKPYKNKHLFALNYGFKNTIKSLPKFLGIVFSIILLFGSYIVIWSRIIDLWSTNTKRENLKVDYIINTIIYDEENNHLKIFPNKEEFLQELYLIPEIGEIYYQYSIQNTIGMGEEYSYFWVLDDKQLTNQGKKMLNIGSPLKPYNMPQNLNFVFGGVSGYGQKELEVAKYFLIEGNIEPKEMAEKPLILLPKYLMWYGNMDIPYTRLSVGDQIKLVVAKKKNFTEIEVVKEYHFQVGGFLSSLPFKQVTGSTTGFVGIMHKEHLFKLMGEQKGIFQIAIIDSPGKYAYPSLAELTRKYNFYLENKKDDFLYKESNMEEKLITYSLNSIFAILTIALFILIFSLNFSEIIMRKKEILTLWVLGMDTSGIKVTILGEILWFGIFGLSLGFLFALFAIWKDFDHRSILSFYQLIPCREIILGIIITLTSLCLSGLVSLKVLLTKVNVQELKKE